MVAAQPRDQALETPARDDRELGGGAASAMLVEHRDESSPTRAENRRESPARIEDRATDLCAMPRADAVRAVADLAGPREGLFGSGVQAGIVLERRMFVAGFSEGRRLALGSRRRSGGSFSGRSRIGHGKIDGGRDLCGWPDPTLPEDLLARGSAERENGVPTRSTDRKRVPAHRFRALGAMLCTSKGLQRSSAASADSTASGGLRRTRSRPSFARTRWPKNCADRAPTCE